jgi:WD40 repeat protein
LVFAVGDTVVASGHHDGRIRFWDVKSGNALKSYNAHTEVVSSLASDAQGRYLVSGSWDHRIKLWKLPPKQ